MRPPICFSLNSDWRPWLSIRALTSSEPPYGPVRTVVWKGGSREALLYPKKCPYAGARCRLAEAARSKNCRTGGASPELAGVSARTSQLRERNSDPQRSMSH